MPRKKHVPRKLPLQARSQATVDAILIATARILVREGFDKASTNRIAHAAGVSVGSLYQYFPNKESLVAALAERHAEQMVALVEAQVPALLEAPVEEAVRTVVDTLLRAHAVDPKLHQVLTEQVPRRWQVDRLGLIEKRVYDLAVAWLTRHADTLAIADPALSAFVLASTIEALTHAAVIHHPELLGDARLTGEITSLVVRYLTAEQPARAAAARRA